MKDMHGSGPGKRGERGAALIVMTVTVLVAATIATSLLLVVSSRSQATTARINMEKALVAAEAGLSRGMAEANLIVNRSNPAWPPMGPGITLAGTSAEVRDALTPGTPVGHFVTLLRSGRSDGIDNDGDGSIDEGATVPPDPNNPGEETYVLVESTGYSGPVAATNPYKVRVKGIFHIMRNEFLVSGALAVGGANPDLKITNSNAFNISGWDHDDDSDTTYDPPTAANPGLPAVALVSPTLNATDTQAIQDAYDSGHVEGVVPSGETMSFATSQPANPIATIVAWAKANATFTKPNTLPGDFNYENVIYHEGATNVAGNDTGAGIWVVNGDLTYSGTCQFKGIMIVTGKLTIQGGGNDYLIRGAAIVGGDAALDFTNNGTTDVRFSSEAVTKAKNSNVYYTQVGWQQVTTNQ